MVVIDNCRVTINSQQRNDKPSGSWVGPIYLNIQDSVIQSCNTGTGSVEDGRDGSTGITFSRCHDTIFRNRIEATNGTITFTSLQTCFIRAGFRGVISDGYGTNIYRGWNNNYTRVGQTWEFQNTSAIVLHMDQETYNRIAASNTTWGNVTVEITDSSDVSVPSTPTSFGVKGQTAYSGGYLYRCINVNTWVRAAVETTW